MFRALLLISCLGALPVAAEDSPEQTLDEVRQQIDTVTESLSADKKSKQELYDELRQQSLKVSELNRSLQETEKDIQSQDQKLLNLQQQLGIEEKQQTAQLEALYQQLRAAYMHAQPGYMEMLLNQQDPALIGRHHTYYQYFHAARQQQLAEIKQRLTNLSEEEKAVFAAQKSLQLLLTEQQAQQSALANQKNQRELTLAALDKKIASQTSQLSELQKQEDELQSLLDTLQKQAAEKPPASVSSQKPLPGIDGLSGSMLWPLKGKLLAQYGTSRKLGKLRWKGIMIGSETGNNVRASAAGKVVFADWLKGFGLLIIVDHGDQFMTLYGNNDSILKTVGESVNAGDVIAQSGNQGVRQLAGLYFEVRHKGRPADPLKWLGKQS